MDCTESTKLNHILNRHWQKKKHISRVCQLGNTKTATFYSRTKLPKFTTLVQLLIGRERPKEILGRRIRSISIEEDGTYLLFCFPSIQLSNNWSLCFIDSNWSPEALRSNIVFFVAMNLDLFGDLGLGFVVDLTWLFQ